MYANKPATSKMCISADYRGLFQDPIGTLSPKGVPTMHWFSQATADVERSIPECTRARYSTSSPNFYILTCGRVGMISRGNLEVQGSIPCDTAGVRKPVRSSQDLSRFSFGHTRHIKIPCSPAREP